MKRLVTSFCDFTEKPTFYEPLEGGSSEEVSLISFSWWFQQQSYLIVQKVLCSWISRLLRAEEEAMASSCFLEMSGPATTRLLRLQDREFCWNLLVITLAGSKQHLQACSYLGLNPFSRAAAPDMQRNANCVPRLLDMTQKTSLKPPSLYSFSMSVKSLLLHLKSEDVPKSCNRT